MKITDQQALQYFYDEVFELVFATEEQVLRLAEGKAGCDIYARWQDYQEEMHIMEQEALVEFGMV